MSTNIVVVMMMMTTTISDEDYDRTFQRRGTTATNLRGAWRCGSPCIIIIVLVIIVTSLLLLLIIIIIIITKDVPHPLCFGWLVGGKCQVRKVINRKIMMMIRRRMMMMAKNVMGNGDDDDDDDDDTSGKMSVGRQGVVLNRLQYSK